MTLENIEKAMHDLEKDSRELRIKYLREQEYLEKMMRDLWVRKQKVCIHNVEYLKFDPENNIYCINCGKGYLSGGLL